MALSRFRAVLTAIGALAAPAAAHAMTDQIAVETFLTYCMTPKMTHADRVSLASELAFRPMGYDVLAQFAPPKGSVGLQGWLATDVVEAAEYLLLVSWVAVEDPAVEGCMVYFDEVDVASVAKTFVAITRGTLIEERDEGGWHEMIYTFSEYPGIATIRFSTGLARTGAALTSLTDRNGAE